MNAENSWTVKISAIGAIHIGTYTAHGINTHFIYTVNVKRFAGLKIHGVIPKKFSQEYFHTALARSI